MDFLTEAQAPGFDDDQTLGVGFFACEPASGGGVALTVAPPYLEESLRSRMASGHAAPYSREALLFGDDFAFDSAQRNTMSALSSAGRPLGRAAVPVSRWLVAGVHPGIFATAGKGVPAENWPAEVAGSGSFSEAVGNLLSGLDRTILGLRPASLMFLLETVLLVRYFKGLCLWKRNVTSDKSWEEFLRLDPARQEEGVGKAILTWMAEEGLHPRVALVCRTPREQESLLLHSHWSLVSSPSCANVQFRL